MIRIFEMYSLSLSIIIRNMIQETLEEAKQRILDSNYMTLNDADIFEMGAKWQAERSISKEAYEDSLNMQRCSNAGYQSKINELKSEISRMYSEKDMRECWKAAYEESFNKWIKNKPKITFKNWFKQFKKK